MATITSANSSLAIAVTDLYPSPQSIQGYAADDAFTADAVEQAEIVMGVDGHMSAGFIFNPTRMTITIMPDSPSLIIFENWQLAQRTAREVYRCNGTVILPAIGRKYSLQNGVLTSGNPFPGNRRTLQPVPFIITWERVIAENN
ncbi:hypothetical protein SAMN05216189_103732 [Pseudomonas delhiensis]|uniref:Uncharacterized protein n=1 Tax=Pseudomonas delhiensis TaxID=366289 RepID=A0A239N083_9PSED|nr:hypothetical protein [Pseudomonas delhiensis]SDK40577.1 hypothetical protein SAMN05216189_103732 [Pseudomonas delhiensis]SNT47852.1 hypothetical protein SAMN06295949_13350 [Pseudomonas delhiensis]